MKKNIIIAIAAVIIVAAGLAITAITLLPKNKPAQVEKTATPTFTQAQIDYSKILSKTGVCGLVTKEKIEEISGTKILLAKPTLNSTQRYTETACEYRQEETKYSGYLDVTKKITIAYLEGDIKDLREIYKKTNYKTKQDNSIPFAHQLVFDENGHFRTLHLFLADNFDVLIHTWQSTLSPEDGLKFAKNFALYFKEITAEKAQSQLPSPTQASEAAPLPEDKEILQNFFSFFGTDDAYKAALMMKTTNDSERQAWAVQFAAFHYLKVLKIEKANLNEWTDNKHIYKVTLDVIMDIEKSANAPIPYYGYQNGENVRWITLEKVDNVWKIAEIATSP
jgi:hypothetical protein